MGSSFGGIAGRTIKMRGVGMNNQYALIRRYCRCHTENRGGVIWQALTSDLQENR